MNEDSRKGSLTSFFIKLIMIIIFAIFALWLLTSVNKGLNNNLNNINNSLNALTDNIFYENIIKMKEAGKEYFTIERLPQNVGDVKNLTLREMYDKKLLLELKDKNGETCSAENSYIKVEKFDKEYQMKVYLECGESKDYITVIMGCYDYCSTTICEKNNSSNTVINNSKKEYEYKKTTGGYWTDYGNWSEWSKIEINKTNYREVETKTVAEQYTYNKTVTNKQYASFITSCPAGYTKTSDGKQCYKVNSSTQQVKPTCPATYNGYKLISQNGFECTYSQTTTSTSDPVCPASYGNGTYTSISNFTCYYKVAGECQTVAGQCQTVAGQCHTVPGECQKVAYQELVNDYCGTILCGQHWETKYRTTCQPDRKVCESDQKICQPDKKVCQPDKTISTKATCKTGYTNINGICTLTNTKNVTVRNATCPSGYQSNNNTCQKGTQTTEYANIINSCPAGYTNNGSNCYKEVSSTVKATGTKNVTYYRYRIRQYIGGSVDTKWSTSNNDSALINAGYNLTGNTRNISGK